MSHVDEGTLHAYLDGELPTGEARDLEAHVAQCRECRVRLDEERALIARADELLGLAAPPDRAIPPFRPGDREPPVRLWWRVRLPLAWAATVVLALGAGLYLGSGVLPRQRAALQNSGDVATAKALTAPAATEPTPSPAAPRQMQRLRSAPAAPTTVAAERKSAVKDQPAEEVASERAAREVQPSAGPPPTPAPTVTRILGPYAVTGPPLTVDSARALLGTDPYALPDVPVRGIYRARMIGYAAVVVVQQPLDSSTAIDVITGRPSVVGLDALVVRGAARRDSVSLPERALLGRAPADSIAAQRRAQPRAAPAPGAFADRPAAAFVVEVRGPLSADSLAALQRRLAPLRP